MGCAGGVGGGGFCREGCEGLVAWGYGGEVGGVLPMISYDCVDGWARVWYSMACLAWLAWHSAMVLGFDGREREGRVIAWPWLR